MTPGDEYDDAPLDGGPDAGEASPDWFPGRHLPEDARRLGLSHHVPDGALLDFAGTLDGAKPVHRVTAWVMLVVFGLPAVLMLLQLLRFAL